MSRMHASDSKPDKAFHTAIRTCHTSCKSLHRIPACASCWIVSKSRVQARSLCRLFYRGLTGYGILLTWLTLLTALATTTLGGRAVSSGSASTQWLAYAVAALGGLHTLLVLLNTRFLSRPPKIA